MPFISEAASAFKSRFGFHDRSAQEPVLSTPDLLQSVTRENPNFSLVSTSAFRRITQWEEEEEEDGSAADSAPAPHAQMSDLSEDPSFWKDHNVQVIIRIRPLSSAEISVQGANKCVRRENSHTLAWMGPPESRFTFDLVADESVSQEQLFKVAGLAMVENCMSGYNSCMFAYGQTGSGKTHTMLGDIEGGTGRHSVNCGMTPRVFNHLFSRIQKEKDARKEEKLKYVCKCSFLEIYNEHILDLLDPSSSNLQIREDVKKGVYVENLKEIEVTSAREVVHQLIQGAANRKVASTNMNRASSRSHSVFTCIIESKWESQGVTHHRFSRLNLVDLAGSERQKSSGAEGDRLKEATNINKSLSTLGLVIMNLVSISNGKSHHVPYRDSKLTFLLQDSLGGNAKTIIIANVSPSQCCSMETLSTLKFAQRAKFIKNNAIVNEDASGDVIAMRIQIQQLKKEVSRLRSLGNGGAENLDNDTPAVSFLGSPGSMNWEGLHGSFTPLVSEKRMSKKKDYEVALVGAFRREKDKDLAIKALTEENQAAMLLAKQREDEIQGLKMRLRFREAGIKRLEEVASGKISAETHLLKEKEEHLKVIEVLRTQVDRNQEVTRFAMENLRLKEEIRRLKSFYEEGEREMMNEQIMVLQNKLLEALDWKLMNESDSVAVQEKANADAGRVAQGNPLSSQEMESTWRSLIGEENEFLRMQAIQNQAETSTLHKQLDFCLEERNRLERQVNDLLKKLEEGSSRPVKEEGHQIELPLLTTDFPVINHSDQMDIKTMVDAIGAASEREAEAHEKAIILSKENDELQLRLEAFIEANDELQSKVKALIDEKNSLIEMYERAASESSYKKMNKGDSSERDDMEVDNDVELTSVKEISYKKMNKGDSSERDDMEVDNDVELTSVKEIEVKLVVSTLEMQLMEMHEENEKLMGLYEKAMHERDEFKRMVASGEKSRGESREELECPEKLVEVDGGECLQSSSVSPTYFDAKFRTEETDLNDGAKIVEANTSKESIEMSAISDGEDFDLHNRASLSNVDQADAGNEIHAGTFTGLGADFSNLSDLNLARTKLEKVHEKLSDSTKSLVVFGSLERAFVEFDTLLKEILAMEEGIWAKQQELRSHEVLFSEMQDRKALLEKKLSALRYSLSCFSSSFAYFEQREARAKARLDASMSYLDQKKQQLAHLQQCRGETEAAQRSVQQSELELRNSLTHLKTKYNEENRRLDNEKVLFATENIEKVDMPQRNWVLGGKATELLKSEEEKTKLQNEMKLSRDKLGLVKKELQDLSKKLEKVESEVLAVQMDVQKGSTTVQDMELALQGVIKEKEALLEVRVNGMSEIQSVILEYQQDVFEADLKEMEMKMLEEELLLEMRRTEALRTDRVVAAEKITKLMEDSNSHLLSTKLEEELQDVQGSLLDARTLLGARSC